MSVAYKSEFMCEHQWRTFGIFFATQKCILCGETRLVPKENNLKREETQ